MTAGSEAQSRAGARKGRVSGRRYAVDSCRIFTAARIALNKNRHRPGLAGRPRTAWAPLDLSRTPRRTGSPPAFAGDDIFCEVRTKAHFRQPPISPYGFTSPSRSRGPAGAALVCRRGRAWPLTRHASATYGLSEAASRLPQSTFIDRFLSAVRQPSASSNGSAGDALTDHTGCRVESPGRVFFQQRFSAENRRPQLHACWWYGLAAFMPVRTSPMSGSRPSRRRPDYRAGAARYEIVDRRRRLTPPARSRRRRSRACLTTPLKAHLADISSESLGRHQRARRERLKTPRVSRKAHRSARGHSASAFWARFRQYLPLAGHRRLEGRPW